MSDLRERLEGAIEWADSVANSPWTKSQVATLREVLASPEKLMKPVAITIDGYVGAGKVVRWQIPVRQQLNGLKLYAAPSGKEPT